MLLHIAFLCVMASLLPSNVMSSSIVRMTAEDQTADMEAEMLRGTWSRRNSTWPSSPPPYDPPQCKKYACPPITVLADRGTYRKIYFPVAPYAKSSLEGETMVPSTLTLYKRLRNYINGHNDKKRTLPMTAPVILRNDVGADGLWSIKNFTLFFYIDPAVKSPPAPTDDDVTVLDVNSYTLYIRTFSGFPVTHADWMRELLQLVADVEADGEPYVKDYFYFTSYDPPFKMTGRINEVQLLKPHPHSSGP